MRTLGGQRIYATPRCNAGRGQDMQRLGNWEGRGAQTRPRSGAPDSLKGMAEEGGNVVFVRSWRKAPNVNSSSMTCGLLRGRRDSRHQACSAMRKSATPCHHYCGDSYLSGEST